MNPSKRLSSAGNTPPMDRRGTFGPELGIPVPKRASTTRALSPTPSIEARPVLYRSPSDVAAIDQEARDTYARGIFADAKPVRNFKVGPELLTEAHRRLIYVLREECQRLYGYNRRTAARLEEANARLKQSRQQVIDLKAELRIMQSKLEEQRESIEEAYETIAEMESKRANRLSRIYQALQESEEPMTVHRAEVARRVSIEHAM